MFIKKMCKIAIIVISVGVYLYSSVNMNKTEEFNVKIDTAKPMSIIWPAEVAVVGDSGEKGFRIGANIGRGWLEEAGGNASYKFYVPFDDKYYIWANCLWFDECSNAVFAKFDNLEKGIIGNDPIYNQWHWVRGFELYLIRGTHELILSNHSDHISLQEILLTNSAYKTPEDCNLVFADIFYDGFDGCDQGNYTSWQKISGTWAVHNPDTQTCLMENSLFGQSEEQAFIIYENNDWHDYSLALSIKILPIDKQSSSVGICFGLIDSDVFYQLLIQPIPDSKKASIQVIDTESKNVGEFELAFETNKWQQVHVSLKDKSIEFKIADNKSAIINIDDDVTGGIGLLLKGEITAYFDDIHIRQISNIQH